MKVQACGIYAHTHSVSRAQNIREPTWALLGVKEACERSGEPAQEFRTAASQTQQWHNSSLRKPPISELKIQTRGTRLPLGCVKLWTAVILSIHRGKAARPIWGLVFSRPRFIASTGPGLSLCLHTGITLKNDRVA
jgi:hypothetical protein